MNFPSIPQAGAGPAPARLIDPAAFNALPGENDWLVRRVLLRGQAAVLGGAAKTMKTSVGVELAVSIGARARFLNEFEVPAAAPVAYVTGEGAVQALAQTVRRVCAAKGLTPDQAGVRWGVGLPRANDEEALAEFAGMVRAGGFAVVFVDPLYACLAPDASGAQAINLHDVGPQVRGLADAVLSAGATPVLVHHMTKTSGRKCRSALHPPALEDLACSGVGELARQWLLLGRRKEYLLGSGRHSLVVAAGGNAGHSGVWEVDIDEGTPGDDPGARRWQTAARPAGGTAQASHPPAAAKAAKRRRSGLERMPNF